MVKHCAESKATDVAIGRPVNCVAKCHVIGGHRFRDRARSAANVEKTARHLLSGADFSKSAVTLGVEIDLERLLTCSDVPLRLHNSKMSAFARFSSSTGILPVGPTRILPVDVLKDTGPARTCPRITRTDPK